MGSVRSTVVACVALIALTLPAVARADTIGPACWQLGSDETYRLFFIVDPTKPVVAHVAGEVLADALAGVVFLPVSGSAIASAAPNIVSVVLTVGPGFGVSTAFFVHAHFNLNDLSGQAVCQLANGAAGGCGMGPRSWTPVACPGGAPL